MNEKIREGRDGEVVQMVRHNDIAWHAHTANETSIGIEHVDDIIADLDQALDATNSIEARTPAALIAAEEH